MSEAVASLVSVHLAPRTLHGWLAKCQFKMTGWGIMFICGMVLRCASTKPSLSLDQLQQICQQLSYIAINYW